MTRNSFDKLAHALAKKALTHSGSMASKGLELQMKLAFVDEFRKIDPGNSLVKTAGFGDFMKKWGPDIALTALMLVPGMQGFGAAGLLARGGIMGARAGLGAYRAAQAGRVAHGLARGSRLGAVTGMTSGAIRGAGTHLSRHLGTRGGMSLKGMAKGIFGRARSLKPIKSFSPIAPNASTAFARQFARLSPGMARTTGATSRVGRLFKPHSVFGAPKTHSKLLMPGVATNTSRVSRIGSAVGAGLGAYYGVPHLYNQAKAVKSGNPMLDMRPLMAGGSGSGGGGGMYRGGGYGLYKATAGRRA